MNYKTLPALLLSAVLLSSCSADTPPPNAESSPRFFIEGELPDIGGYSGKELIKYHENASETFVPSDSYGTLIPFTSRIKEYSGNSFGADVVMTYANQGICTADGQIVVLPSDASVHYEDYYEEFPYITFTPYNEENIEMMLPSSTTIIPIHGKWSIDLPEGAWLTGAGDGVLSVIQCTNPESYDFDKLVCYDYNGEKLFEKDGVYHAGTFSNGYINVSFTGDNIDKSSCYLDKNGTIATKMYRTCQPFNEHGIAYVFEYSGHAYLINTNFEKISDVYESIYFDEDFIVARNSNFVDIFTLDGTYIETVVANGYVTVHPGKKIIYSHNEGGTEYYKNLDGANFVSEDGKAPNTYSSLKGYFTHKDENSNTSTIFDAEGKVIARLKNCESASFITPDEKLIVYQRGSYEFKDFENGRPVYSDPIKTVIYDTENGKELFILDGPGGIHYDNNQGRYITIFTYSDMDFGSVTKYHLFDTLEKKFIFEDCYEISAFDVQGDKLYSVVTESFCTLYDKDFKKILRVINE